MITIKDVEVQHVIRKLIKFNI